MIYRVVIGSYLAQAYVALIGAVLMPTYLHIMGAPAFGLVGLFLMLQSWVQLLDLGISPTLSREMALYKAHVLSAGAALLRLRTLEWLLGCVAVLGMGALVLGRTWIAQDWLHLDSMSVAAVARILAVMAVAAGLRWIASMYRAGLVGLERQTLVNTLGVLFATLRYVGVLVWIPVLREWPIIFFVHQLAVGALEVVTYSALIRRILPAEPGVRRFSMQLFRDLAPMAGSMALLGGIWIVITQFDKLVLSHVLTLADYGYFSVAVLAAAGVLMLMPPLNQVLQPRMTILAAQGRDEALMHLYRLATQLLVAVVAAAGASMAWLPRQILFAWSGNSVLAAAAAPILEWYAPAYACAALLTLPFLLQFAKGSLRLHVWGNLLLMFILLPMLMLTAERWGAVGTGATLCVTYGAFLLLWVTVIHRRFLRGHAIGWLIEDVAPVAGVAIVITRVVAALAPTDAGRLSCAVLVAFAASTGALAGLLGGSLSRKALLSLVGYRAWTP